MIITAQVESMNQVSLYEPNTISFFPFSNCRILIVRDKTQYYVLSNDKLNKTEQLITIALSGLSNVNLINPQEEYTHTMYNILSL